MNVKFGQWGRFFLTTIGIHFGYGFKLVKKNLTTPAPSSVSLESHKTAFFALDKISRI